LIRAGGTTPHPPLDQGSAEKAWSVRWEIDGDLRWDADIQVWVGGDGYAYDGARLLGYARAGDVLCYTHPASPTS